MQERENLDVAYKLLIKGMDVFLQHGQPQWITSYNPLIVRSLLLGEGFLHIINPSVDPGVTETGCVHISADNVLFSFKKTRRNQGGHHVLEEMTGDEAIPLLEEGLDRMLKDVAH